MLKVTVALLDSQVFLSAAAAVFLFFSLSFRHLQTHSLLSSSAFLGWTDYQAASFLCFLCGSFKSVSLSKSQVMESNVWKNWSNPPKRVCCLLCVAVWLCVRGQPQHRGLPPQGARLLLRLQLRSHQGLRHLLSQDAGWASVRMESCLIPVEA